MMWIYLAVFFLSVGDIFGENCHERYQTECHSIEPPQRFPENKEELANVCSYMYKVRKCLVNVAESCKEEEEEATVNHQMLSSIETVCDRENPNYIAISNNLECISSTAPSLDDLCEAGSVSEKRRNLTRAYAETVKDKIVDGRSMLTDCVGSIFDIACYTAEISEECGGELFQPVLQSLMEVYMFHLDFFCHEDTIAEIPMFAFALAMVEKEAEHANHDVEKPMQAPFDKLFNSFK